MTFHKSLRRKIALATWSNPKEGNIYGKMSMDMTNALKYIEFLRSKFNEKVTVTHLVGRAAALTFKECPDINGYIYMGNYYSHRHVDMSFLVSLEGGKELYKCKIFDMDQKKTTDIAKELKEKAEKLKAGKDKDYEKPKKLIRMLPTWAIRIMLWLTGFITSSLGWDLKFLGLSRFPFGSCIITSIGMFGIDEGFAPPTPFARVPVYLALPRIKDTAVVIDKKIEIRPILNIMTTIDHRFLDGHRGAMMGNRLREFLENPWLMDGFSESEVNNLEVIS